MDVMLVLEYKKFKKILDALHKINTRVLLEFELDKGFRVIVRDGDPSECFCELYIDKTAFREFWMDWKNPSVSFVIDTKILKSEFIDILKGTEHEVIMEADTEQERFYIKIGQIVRKFSIVEGYDEIKTMKFKKDFTAHFEMKRSNFKRDITAVSTLTNFVDMTVREDGIRYYGQSGSETIDIKVKKDDKVIENFEWSSDAQSKYRVEAILKGLGAIESSALMRVSIGNSTPLRAVWQPFEGSAIRVHVLNIGGDD